MSNRWRKLLPMRPPSKKEAAGYDIIVWIDKDGDVVARAFTTKGDDVFKEMVDNYQKYDIMIIYSNPVDFYNSLPKGLNVGLKNQTGIGKMILPSLH